MNTILQTVYDFFVTKVYEKVSTNDVEDPPISSSSSDSSFSIPEFPTMYENELFITRTAYESILERMENSCVAYMDGGVLKTSPFMFQYTTGDECFLKELENIIKNMTHIFKEYKIIYAPRSQLEAWLLWTSITQATMMREEEIYITKTLFKNSNFLYKLYSSEKWLYRIQSNKYIIRIHESVVIT